MERDEARILVPAENIEQSHRDFPGAYDEESIQVFHAVRALAQRMNDGASEWLAPFGLSAAKFNYLAVLYARRRKGVSPNELGASVHTVSGTVTSMIDALARDGLIVRRPHPSDGRSTLLKVTLKGRRLFVRAANAHHAYVAETLAPLASNERQRLLSLLVRIGNSLEESVAVEEVER